MSIAKLAPGQSDEDIIERDLTMGHLAHAGVILVLPDETSRSIDRSRPSIALSVLVFPAPFGVGYGRAPYSPKEPWY